MYIYTNNKMMGNIDRTSNEFVGESQKVFEPVLNPEDKDLFYYNTENLSLLQKQSVRDIEIRIYNIHRQIRWLSIRESVFERDPQGNVIKVLGSAGDISSKKAAELNLIAEKRLNQRIFNLTPDVIFILDLQSGTNVFENRPALELLDYKITEIGHRNISTSYELVHPDDRESLNKDLQKILQLNDDEVYTFEHRFLSQNGDYKWISNSMIVFDRDAQGIPTLVLGLGTDVHHRKQNEMELSKTNAELKKANEELDSFVYRASHNLRSPLTSVLVLVNLLQTTPLSEEQRQYNQMIKRSVEKLMNVINDLINHTRNNRAEIVLTPLNMRLLVEDVLSDLRYLTNASRIEFRIDVDENMLLVSDELRLHLLLINLLSNAIKYHDLSKPNPYISIKLVSQNHQVELEVSDNGLGIENELQDKVFNMFFRASKDSTGSGMGLYIVKGIMEKLDGQIKMHSVHTKGTTFTCVFPNHYHISPNH